MYNNLWLSGQARVKCPVIHPAELYLTSGGLKSCTHIIYNTSRAWHSRMIMHKHAAVHVQMEYAKALIGKIHVMSLHTMTAHM